MFKRFEILDFGSPEFDKRLKEVAEPYEGNQAPWSRIKQALAQPPWTCRTVVIEHDYVDKDYRSEFGAFYSQGFKDYPPRCVRLHFFQATIPKRTRSGFGRFEKGYLGFAVIRPTDLQRVGRTLLTPPIIDSNKQFIHCQAEFDAHILGERLCVRGMPFTQQDSQVGACAQASLWMLARYMSRRYGHREFLPAEINELAKTHMAKGRHLPAERGLNLYQILDALEGMGLSAISYGITSVDNCSPHIGKAFPFDPMATQQEQTLQLQARRRAKLADIGYRYIESSLPVILCTSNHAVVGIGHTYDPSATAAVAIQRIPAFFIHNDNSGPYREMRLFDQSSPDLPFSSVETVVAVVPREVTLRGEEAEVMAAQRIKEFLREAVPNRINLVYKDLIAALHPDLTEDLDNLEFRTYLRPSFAFQGELRLINKERPFDRRVAQLLIRLDYPRFIWITEVSSSSLLNRPNRKERKCLGRVIIDSTAPAKSRGEMVIHFGDFLQLSDRQTGERRPWEYLADSTPFGHKLFS